MSLLWLYELLFVVYVLLVSAIVLLERRRPSTTVAWLLALIFLPVVGLVLYLLFGGRRIRHTMARRRRSVNPIEATSRVAVCRIDAETLPHSILGLVRLAEKTASAPLRRADRVDLLELPPDAMAAMESAIASAQHRVHLLFYIWRGDETGQRWVEALAERARAGVVVRLLVDDLGSLTTPSRHFAPLVEAGGRVERFGRVRLRIPRGPDRLNYRNHRKILTVDGKVGFMGGLNIADEYRGVDHRGRMWNDLQMQIDGDAVVGLESIFSEDWQRATGELVEIGADLPEELAVTRRPMRERPVTESRSRGPLVQVIPSGPDRRVAPELAAQLLSAIGIAQERCWITTPYFVPDDALALLLRTAALRGVDVRILVPSPENNDNRIVGIAGRSYYLELLRSGCRIFEYQAGMLHAKYLVVDSAVAVVGSANMDVRSFYINYEVSAMFYDEGVAERLGHVWQEDCREAREISEEEVASRSIAGRLAESGARLLSPLL